MTSYYNQTKLNVLTGMGKPLAEHPTSGGIFQPLPTLLDVAGTVILLFPKMWSSFATQAFSLAFVSLWHACPQIRSQSLTSDLFCVLSSKSLSLTLSSESAWSCHLMTYPSPPLLNFLLSSTMTWWYITHVPTDLFTDWCSGVLATSRQGLCLSSC